jgi:hypothetical protein
MSCTIAVIASPVAVRPDGIVLPLQLQDGIDVLGERAPLREWDDMSGPFRGEDSADEGFRGGMHDILTLSIISIC